MSTHVADDAHDEVTPAVSMGPTTSTRPTPTARSTATQMDLLYVKVAGVLVVLTAIEIYASYADYLDKAFLPADAGPDGDQVPPRGAVLHAPAAGTRKLFGRLFWAGALLAVAVYVGALATFQYFAKA